MQAATASCEGSPCQGGQRWDRCTAWWSPRGGQCSNSQRIPGEALCRSGTQGAPSRNRSRQAPLPAAWYPPLGKGGRRGLPFGLGAPSVGRLGGGLSIALFVNPR
eukprot:CAMPEP_0173438614 /NCGR_PEP_ID=MMETSP1357-20121228/20507_1 /TAXON_ID=77926 /ORGANISM="Hemiselmis rufescens, Strain PCC563" /LENGTH=104 /DNA_ID=CAMNT_0014403917 /DNA_START=300 /DNA_END=611 /DNA_ORIENTATION=-